MEAEKGASDWRSCCSKIDGVSSALALKKSACTHIEGDSKRHLTTTQLGDAVCVRVCLVGFAGA